MIKHTIKKTVIAAIAFMVISSLLFLVIASKEKNVFDNYADYFSELFSKAEFGTTTNLSDGSSVEILSSGLDSLKFTSIWVGTSFLVSVILGIFIGFLSARYQKTIIGRNLRYLKFLLMGVTVFISSYIFFYISDVLSWDSVFTSYADSSWGDMFKALLFPIFSLSFLFTLVVSERVKLEVTKTLNKGYTIFAEQNGMSKTKIIRKYILKDVISNLIKFAIPLFLLMSLSGMIIEQLYSIPGIWILFENTFENNDPKTLLFIGNFFLAASLLNYILGDLLAVMITPTKKAKIFDKEYTSTKKWPADKHFRVFNSNQKSINVEKAAKRISEEKEEIDESKHPREKIKKPKYKKEKIKQDKPVKEKIKKQKPVKEKIKKLKPVKTKKQKPVKEKTKKSNPAPTDVKGGE